MLKLNLPNKIIVKGAIISENQLFRYHLCRYWDAGEDAKHALFIMLNPSTADADNDDPTIRKCMHYAMLFGYGGIDVVNLFALRSPSPAVLRKVLLPVGIKNDETILHYALQASIVIAAWGHGGKLDGRARKVKDMLCRCGIELMCLQKSKDGTPKHPLYLRCDLPELVKL
jgi:hypothetical protein